MPSCVWAQKALEQREVRSGAAYHDPKERHTEKCVALLSKCG